MLEIEIDLLLYLITLMLLLFITGEELRALCHNKTKRLEREANSIYRISPVNCHINSKKQEVYNRKQYMSEKWGQDRKYDYMQVHYDSDVDVFHQSHTKPYSSKHSQSRSNHEIPYSVLPHAPMSDYQRYGCKESVYDYHRHSRPHHIPPLNISRKSQKHFHMPRNNSSPDINLKVHHTIEQESDQFPIITSIRSLRSMPYSVDPDGNYNQHFGKFEQLHESSIPLDKNMKFMKPLEKGSFGQSNQISLEFDQHLPKVCRYDVAPHQKETKKISVDARAVLGTLPMNKGLDTDNVEGIRETYAGKSYNDICRDAGINFKDSNSAVSNKLGGPDVFKIEVEENFPDKCKLPNRVSTEHNDNDLTTKESKVALCKVSGSEEDLEKSIVKTSLSTQLIVNISSSSSKCKQLSSIDQNEQLKIKVEGEHSLWTQESTVINDSTSLDNIAVPKVRFSLSDYSPIYSDAKTSSVVDDTNLQKLGVKTSLRDCVISDSPETTGNNVHLANSSIKSEIAPSSFSIKNEMDIDISKSSDSMLATSKENIDLSSTASAGNNCKSSLYQFQKPKTSNKNSVDNHDMTISSKAVSTPPITPENCIQSQSLALTRKLVDSANIIHIGNSIVGQTVTPQNRESKCVSVRGFECDICGSIYSTYLMMRAHRYQMHEHSSNKPVFQRAIAPKLLACGGCNRLFPNSGELDLHKGLCSSELKLPILPLGVKVQAATANIFFTKGKTFDSKSLAVNDIEMSRGLPKGKEEYDGNDETHLNGDVVDDDCDVSSLFLFMCERCTYRCETEEKLVEHRKCHDNKRYNFRRKSTNIPPSALIDNSGESDVEI